MTSMRACIVSHVFAQLVPLNVYLTHLFVTNGIATCGHAQWPLSIVVDGTCR